ncbi:hypothetical protein QJS83_15720 [Bdellovibrio sp. 22V]|uniref:hypothetical protein n=1 Tax=Bdellovibrio TaxID=958 RepID=UPI0025436BF3|nr:hypothetical protein [Bdellovibrio sp. 22V]WII71912.1 hypothetical protein QJS83_15720 [Bdellovibrio sp. 22V]
MKALIVTFALVFAFGPHSSADDTTSTGDKANQTWENTKSKAKEAGDNVSDAAKKAGRKTKATAKKGAHRVEEAVCMEGDLECAAKKAANRAEEGGEAVKNKAKDTKDKVTE